MYAHAAVFDWLVAKRIWLLGVAVLVGVAAGFQGNQLALDRAIEPMFAADDPLLKPYHALQREFGKSEIALLVYADPEFATPAGLERVGALAAKVREVPGVVAAVSLLDPPGAADFANHGRSERLRKVLAGFTHNAELTAAGVICLLSTDTHGEVTRGETLRRLHALVDPMPQGALVGEPVLIEEAFDLLEDDGQRLNLWCTVLLMATIFLCTPGLRWMILPLAVVQLSLALTRGALAAAGLELSMVSSMLSAIVTVVGVATVVHVIVRFRDARSRGMAPHEAFRSSIELLAAPVVVACLTDGAGFGALMVSAVGPVHDFGLMMAVGCGMVLVSVVLVTPGIVLFGSHAERIADSKSDQFIQRQLGKVLQWSLGHTKQIGWTTCGLTVAAIVGSTMLERETDFTKNFHDESEIVRGYRFVEEQFGGAGVWYVLLPAPQELSVEYLREVTAFEARLVDEVPQLNKAISLADIISAGVGDLGNLRFGGGLAVRTALGLMRAQTPEFVEAIYNAGPGVESPYLRVMLRSNERLDSAAKTAMIDQVRRITHESYPAGQVTGVYVLLTQLIESLLRDQWSTFGVAGVAILLMMAVAFRSWKLALATLLPNALPALVLFGAMGWLGVPINMGAAMIAAVSLGLSVDGSIHYVMSYQRERRAGASLAEALTAVQNTVGRAAIFATLALVVGFATLAVSEFVPTVYFGTLVSISMVGGLMGNLALLPVLIQVCEKK